MMGRREDGQGQFFYAFDLDKVVPQPTCATAIQNSRARSRRRALGTRRPTDWLAPQPGIKSRGTGSIWKHF
jgi:hypothetical protein